MSRQPTPRKPVLVWCRDEVLERLDEMALERAGREELDHPLNRPILVDMSHCVTACGKCGGVYGGDGIKRAADGTIIGRCPTKRCTCREKKPRKKK